MVEIPDRLECLFSAPMEREDDIYSIEVPQSELEHGTITSDETYRVLVLSSTPQTEANDTHPQTESASSVDSTAADAQTPPVSVGDIREVTIETLGDQDDGIAKLEHGYVVIVPGTTPDDEVTIEITQARENVAFAQVRDNDNETDTDEPSDLDESFENDTLR